MVVFCYSFLSFTNEVDEVQTVVMPKRTTNQTSVRFILRGDITAFMTNRTFRLPGALWRHLLNIQRANWWQSLLFTTAQLHFVCQNSGVKRKVDACVETAKPLLSTFKLFRKETACYHTYQRRSLNGGNLLSLISPLFMIKIYPFCIEQQMPDGLFAPVPFLARSSAM